MLPEKLMVELPLPERADEPLASQQYYHLVPVQQPDPDRPLCLAIERDEFEEYTRLVLAPKTADGNTHFRVEHGRRDIRRLLSRNSGKTLYLANDKLVQFTHPQDDQTLAALKFVPSGRYRFRIACHGDESLQLRLEGGMAAGSGLLMTAGGPGLEFYFVPVTQFVWLDNGETRHGPYQDATEMILRKIADGALGFAGDKLSELADIPGGAMILNGVFSLIFPEKTIDEILAEFRQHLLEDMRRLQATDTLIKATNELIDTRKKFAMQYRSIRASDIDRADARASLRETALRYADDYSRAILKLLPGVTKDDGSINVPIPEEHFALVKAGLSVYVQGAIDHIGALQERALLDAFDPACVTRSYAKNELGLHLEAGSDDRVRFGLSGRDRAKTLSLVNLVDGTLGHGDLIALKVSNGRYISSFFGNYGVITAIRKQRGQWETFRLVRVAGPGKLQVGDRIALAYEEGGYLSLDNDQTGELGVGSPTIGDKETFFVYQPGSGGVIRSGAAIGLRASNNKYLCALEGGGGPVVADREHWAGWETLTIERVSVGSVLHYGNKVVIRRPTDGRFASLVKKDGLRHLMVENSKISKDTVFTVTGGPDGREVSSGSVFQLQSSSGFYLRAGSLGDLLENDVAGNFTAEILAGEQRALTVGEPVDWIKSYIDTYTGNIHAMAIYLILKRIGRLHKQRDEIAKIGGYRVLLEDRLIGRTLFRGMESGPQDFKQSDEWIERISNLYKNHVAMDDMVFRYHPLLFVVQFGQIVAATDAMCKRLRRNPDVCTEFWRKAVLPDRAEWDL